MEQGEPERRDDVVAGRVAKLALAGMRGDSLRTYEEIREYARGLLDGGHPRQKLYEDLLRAVQEVRRRAPADDEAEDPILDVMDGLVGRCSPGARL